MVIRRIYFSKSRVKTFILRSGPAAKLKGVCASFRMNSWRDDWFGFNVSWVIERVRTGKITWVASPSLEGKIVLRDSCLWIRALIAFSRIFMFKGPDKLRAIGIL